MKSKAEPENNVFQQNQGLGSIGKWKHICIYLYGVNHGVY